MAFFFFSLHPRGVATFEVVVMKKTAKKRYFGSPASKQKRKKLAKNTDIYKEI